MQWQFREFDRMFLFEEELVKLDISEKRKNDWINEKDHNSVQKITYYICKLSQNGVVDWAGKINVRLKIRVHFKSMSC